MTWCWTIWLSRRARRISRTCAITRPLLILSLLLLLLLPPRLCGHAMAAEYGAITVTPANDAQWSTNLSNNENMIQGNLIINDGAVLSIESATLKTRRYDSSGWQYPAIIVRNNGTLNVNDSTITRDTYYYSWRYESGSRGNLTNSTVEFCIQNDGFAIETNETVSLFNVTFDHGDEDHPSDCYAIYLNSASNASIRGCAIRASSTQDYSDRRYTCAIHINNSQLCNLTDNTIEEKSSYRHGIHILNSGNNMLINNGITRGAHSSASHDAMHIEASFNNTLRDLMIAGGANQHGIYCGSSNNTSVINCTIDCARDCGIHVRSSQFCNLSENNVTGSATNAIYLLDSDNTALLTNEIDQSIDGICLNSSDSAILTGNSVNGSSRYGVNITASEKSVLRSNILTNSIDYNLYVTGEYDQDIDTSNTVNGGRVYYNYTDSGTITDTNIGHVTIVDCSDLWFTNCVVHNGDGVRIRGVSSNVGIRGGTIENNTVYGINLESTRYNNITSVNITDSTKEGVYLYNSSYNLINKSDIRDNSEYGVHSGESSGYNRIIENNIINNTRGGVCLQGLGYNDIITNNVSENRGDGGICIGGYHNSLLSTQNTLTNNTILSNNNTGIGAYTNYNTLSDNAISTANGQYALKISHAVGSYYNYIWRNNTANGEQINYYYNERDTITELGNNIIESKHLTAQNVSNVGKITLVNCYNLTVRDNALSNNAYHGSGIFLWNSDENALSNNTISNNHDGIKLYNSSNNDITNLRTVGSGNLYYGAHIQAESDYNNIMESNIAGITYNGMWIASSDNNIITDTTISSAESDGLYASGANYTNLTNVTVTAPTKKGVCISTSDHVTIEESNITANTIGVDYSSGANYTDVIDTRITAGTDGIHIAQSHRGNFTNNTIIAAERGIVLTESRDHNLTENNVRDYTSIGILLLEYSTNTTIIGNDFTRNGSKFDIKINDSNDCTIANNESTAANYTFYLTNDTRLATLDTVFDKAAVGYEDTSNLTMMWRIDVLCWDNYHLEPMWTNLTVSYRDISDYNESLCWDGVTPNANGRLSGNAFGDYGPPTAGSNWLSVIEYKENVTGKTIYQPMNCTAVNRWDVLNGIHDRRYKNLTTTIAEPGVTILMDTGHTPNGRCYYCHDDKLRYADGTFKFPKTTHWTKYDESIMSATPEDPYTPGRCIDCHNETDSSSVPHGTASGKDLLYQPSPQLCYNGKGDQTCHNSSTVRPTLNQKEEFSQTTHHPLGDGKLACKACHDNHGSTYRYDLVKYYTNGTNSDTGSSESGYNSAYYALCLVCHLEEKLVAKMVTEDDTYLQDYTNQTNFRDEYYGWSAGFNSSNSPINLHSPQGTGFSHSAGNCYLCHNPHGSNNPATTRYTAPGGGIFNYTYITNLTPPSETYPEGETNWEVLGLANWLNPTLNQGGGLYLAERGCGCHSSGWASLQATYFTYRTYVNYTPAGGAGCVECHDNDASAYNEPPIRPIVNLTAMKLAMHTDLSGAFRTGSTLQGTSRTFTEWLQYREYTAEQIANISTDNAICWACHSTNGTPPAPNFHPDRALNPYKCPKCHGPEDSQPPHTKGLVAAIDNHGPTTKGAGSVYIQTTVGTNGSCEDCHAPSVLPSSYIGELKVWKYGTSASPTIDFVDYTGTTTMGNVSHYGLNRSQGLALGITNPLFGTGDCLYCHCNSANGLVWGNAPDVSGNMYGADTSNISECYTYCHVLPDHIGSVNEMNIPHFHNRSLYAGGGPDCVVCHDDMGGSNPYGVQSRVNVTSIAHGIHANVTNNTIGIVANIDPRSKACWGCHQSDGMEPQGMGDRNGIVDPNKKPWTCEDCHARSSEWNASTNYGETWISSGYPPNSLPPRIYTHQPNSTTLKTNVESAGRCADCHIRSIDTDHNDTAEKVLGNTIFSNTSHYGEVAGLVTPTTNCSVCHCDSAGGARWGGAPQVTHGNTTNCTNAVDGCYVCHSTDNQVSADFHASNLLSGEGGSDCLRCHGKTGFASGKRIDEDVFATSIHGRVNGAVSDLNRSCWACHFDNGTNASEHSMRKAQPYRCYDCHNKVGGPFANVTDAPNAHNHFKSGTSIEAYRDEATDSESCMKCHNKSEMFYTFDENDAYCTNFSITSHYGNNRTDIVTLYNLTDSTNYCQYCHRNSSTPFIDRISLKSINHHGSSSCDECHGTGRLHNGTLTRVSTPGNCTDCHALYGDAQPGMKYKINVTAMNLGVHADVNENLTAIAAAAPINDANNAKCWGCHVPKGECPEDGHKGTFNNDAYLCYDCHNGTAAYQNVNSATAVYNHFKSGVNITARTVAETDSYSCGYGCHNLSTMKVPGFEGISGQADYRENMSQASHYPRNRSDIIMEDDLSDCAFCHLDSTNEFLEIFENPSKANIAHATETQSCITLGCHNKGRIHDLNLSGGDAGPDCLRCHGRTGFASSRRIDETAFEIAIHGRVNDASTDLNRSCWACHFEDGLNADSHTTRKAQPYLCYDCHNKGNPPFTNVSNAPNAFNHYKSGTSIEAYWTQATDSESCMGCHDQDEMKYAFDENDAYSTNFSITSHYGDNRTELVSKYNPSNSTDYCAYCHINASSPFFEYPNNRDIQHAGTQGCNLCHGDGRLHNETLTRVKTTGNCTDCHALYGDNTSQTRYHINVSAMNLGVHAGVNSNMATIATTEVADANNAKCWGCHVQDGAYPADGHGGIFNNAAYLCYDCHNGTAAYANVSSATAVYNHFKSGVNITARTVAGTDSESCGYGCHNLSSMKVPGFDASGNASYLVNMSQASHYPRNRSDIILADDLSDCTFCHKDSDNEFAPIFERPSKANISHASEITSCITPGCHNRGRIHDMSLSGGDAGPDCLRCHGRAGIITGRRIDETAFETSIHGSVNDAASDLNRSCWACHFENGTGADSHPNRKSPPYLCYDCHNKVGAPFANVSNAPNAFNHYKSGTSIEAYWTQATDSESCMGCHNQSEMFYAFDENDTYATNFSITSHYGNNRTDLVALYDPADNTDYCAYCHINTSTPFMEYENDRNIRHAGNQGCNVCHGEGRLHNETLTRVVTTGNCTDCHSLYGVNMTQTRYHINVSAMNLGVHAGVNSNMTTIAISEVADANNAKCWGCHVQDGAYPADGHGDIFNNDAYLCYECHNGTVAYQNVTSATAVYNHFKSGVNIKARTVAETDSFSCGYGCHNLSTMKVSGFNAGENASYRVNLSQSSHYPRSRPDIANVSGGYSDCGWCHLDSTNEFVAIFENPGLANITHASQTRSCIVEGCHNKGRIHDLNLTFPDWDLGRECANCHISGGANTSGIVAIINNTGFETSIHRNITGEYNSSNYTAISRGCWGCHNNYTEQAADPKKHATIKPGCEDCHNSATPQNMDNLSENLRQVTEHQPNGTDITTNGTIASCIICHNRSLTIGMPPSDRVVSKTPQNAISHYGRQRTDMIEGFVTNCSYCHCDSTNSFSDTFDNANNTNITHGGGYSANCTDCHGSGRFHDAALSAPVMTPGNNSFCMNTACHGNNQKSWFVDDAAFTTKIHGSINCTDCHVPLPVRVGGSVGAGGTYTRAFTVPDDVKLLNVTLNWARGSLNLTLDANETVINQTVAAGNSSIDYTMSGTVMRYSIEDPASGSWIACITDVSAATTFNLDIEFIQKHPKSGACFANPCESCHVTDISYNAPPVAEHVTRGTATGAGVWTNASCAACHANDITLPSSLGGSGVDKGNNDAMTAHYGSHLIYDTAECNSCHEDDDISAKWADANDPRNFTRHEAVRKVLRTGKVWKLKNEYEIVVGPISSSGSSIRVNLMHDGAVVKDELVTVGDNFEYEVKRLAESGDVAICNLTVSNIFAAGLWGVVTFDGTVLVSRVHIETANEDCYACHISGYRYGVGDGDEYIVLRNDGEDVTIGKLPVNFTENERRIFGVGYVWDLGHEYTLTVAEVDLKGGKARLELALNGTVLESEVVGEGGMFTYNTTIRDRKGHQINDVTVFQVRVAGVFRI